MANINTTINAPMIINTIAIVLIELLESSLVFGDGEGEGVGHTDSAYDDGIEYEPSGNVDPIYDAFGFKLFV